MWLASVLPGVAVARSYQREWLRRDLLAGLALTAFLVPQGIAYAELAGLPPVTGLYATLIPLLVYAAAGPSRILVLGPDSALAPLVAATVIPLAGDDSAERIALASLLAVLAGGLLLAGAVARLGFLTDLLSKPVRIGYLAGVAFLVLIEQVPELLGYEAESGNLLDDMAGLIKGLDDIDPDTALIGILCLVIIIEARRLSGAMPGVLVAVVGATLLVEGLDLEVAVIGPVPGGLPSPAIPTPSVDDAGRLTLGAVAIALLAFADTSVLSRSYASRLGERVDQSHELAALGAANVAAGLFHGFPISSSSSRTPVAESAGSRTQLTGVVAAAALAAVLVAGTGLLHGIPLAALAAVVIAAVIRLVDLSALRSLLQTNRADFTLAVVSFLGVAVFGILAGVGIAIGLSVLALLERAWHPYSAVLGRVSGLQGYHDQVRHPEGRQVPGLLIFRFDAPLFFANAEVFRDAVHRALASAPSRIARVTVAAEPITDVDSTAADTLVGLLDDLDRQGIEFSFAEIKGPVKDKLQRYGIYERIGEEQFYRTIGEAVHKYVEEKGVDWRDWEDEEEERN